MTAPTPLTRRDLDGMGCQVPGCVHAHEVDTPIVLKARCHPQVGVVATYGKDGVLTVCCRRCKKFIAALAIAP